MNYRNFKAAGIDVSLLGFGAMRLPTLGDDISQIDEAEAIRMIRYAIDHGVNYVDTAYVYHNEQSEVVVGKALADGYREKTLVATKMPFWRMKGPEEMGPTLDKQLEKLATDHIDMYLIHDIKGANWDKVLNWKIYDFLREQREAGKIRFIGFSSHCESPKEFKAIIDEYPWDFCQLQINYMDKNIQAGVEGYEHAVSKGIPIVVMEPLKGGKLTDAMPPSIQKYWDSLSSDRTPAEWAFRWVANLPGILTILSGMNKMEQVEENVRVLSAADIEKLSESDLAVIDKAAEEYNKLIAYQCTTCRYCLPCAVEINIPKAMEFRNSYDIYGKTQRMQNDYDHFLRVKPSACIACGKCEAECPQHLNIIQAMKENVALFE